MNKSTAIRVDASAAAPSVLSARPTAGPSPGAPALASSSTPPADGRALRWHEHRTKRRTVLIKAARRAVHELGHGASMEEIATAAGTSKSVFYRYFGDKAGLQRAMGEVVIGAMQEKLVSAAQTAKTARDGLYAMVSAYLQMAETSPAVYAFVTRIGSADALSNPGDDESSGTLTHFFTAIREMMTEPMRSYLKNQPPARVEITLTYWPTAAIGQVRAAGELWLGTPNSAQKPSREAMAEQITQWLFAGIAINNAGATDPAAPKDPIHIEKDQS